LVESVRALGVRVLAIETSSPRGSVALTERGRVIVSFDHEQANAHAERLLPLVERAIAESGFSKRSLERVAVGVGPGSFTGLRVGIAHAEGIALGLGIPLVGVGALRAMAATARDGDGRLRVPVLDARRDEVFVAAYTHEGEERLAPTALPRASALGELEKLGPDLCFIGAAAALLSETVERLEGRDHDLPHAREVALLGSRLDPARHPPDPIYVRGVGATLPNLPPSPLAVDVP
jgi:tRNA threonylcarbamoyladenosine biosynthesis protein TsaB